MADDGNTDERFPDTMQDVASCLGCDYPLRGITEKRCPECGRAFNPDDYTTMRVPDAPPLVPAWWYNRPRPKPRATPMSRGASALILFVAGTAYIALGSPWRPWQRGEFGGLWFYGLILWAFGIGYAIAAVAESGRLRLWRAACVVALLALAVPLSSFRNRCPHEDAVYIGFVRIPIWTHPLGPCRNPARMLPLFWDP